MAQGNDKKGLAQDQKVISPEAPSPSTGESDPNVPLVDKKEGLKSEKQKAPAKAKYRYVGQKYKTGLQVHGVGFIKDPLSMSDREIDKLMKVHKGKLGNVWVLEDPV